YLARPSIAFPFQPLAQHLAVATNRLRFLANPTLGRLFVGPAALHVAEGALPLHLLFQHPQRGVDVVIANEDLHGRAVPLSLCSVVLLAARKEPGEPAPPRFVKPAAG